MAREYLAARVRVVTGRDGEIAFAIDPQRCASCQGCFWRSPERIVCPAQLLDTCVLEPGRSVTVRLPVTTAMLASLMLYGVPLVAVLCGALLGAAFDTRGDLGAVIGAVTGLLAGACTMHLARAGIERTLRERVSVDDR